MAKIEQTMIDKLKELHTNPDVYDGPFYQDVCEFIIANYGGHDNPCPLDKVSETEMIEVATLMPADQATYMIRSLSHQKDLMTGWFQHIITAYPDLAKRLVDNIKYYGPTW